MSTKRQNKKEGKQKILQNKKYSLPQQEPIQSIKSTKGIVPPPIFTLTHRDRLLRKLLSMSVKAEPNKLKNE